MKTLKDMDLRNKRVVLRCDFNVPVDNGKVVDNSKLINSLKTINYLLDNNCSVCILSHLGRVKTNEDKLKNSLKVVAHELSNNLKKEVKFINNCYGEEVKKLVLNNELGSVIVLENTRWMDYPEKLESNNDINLSKYFASLGDVFVNDAFGSLHRAHASTAGIAKFIPSCIGFLVEDELSNLDVIIKNTPRPFTVFMGGAKVDDKLPIIKSLLPKCDYLLLGGGIANSFLKAKGADVGSSLVTHDELIINELKELLSKYKEKIILPIDFIIDDDAIYDIGIKTLELYKSYIVRSSIIFVNGTSGKFEDERFTEGTSGLFEILKNSGKEVIVGGGDTVSALKLFGYKDVFKFASTGGGATLEYIANGKLDALDWIGK